MNKISSRYQTNYAQKKKNAGVEEKKEQRERLKGKEFIFPFLQRIYSVQNKFRIAQDAKIDFAHLAKMDSTVAGC